MTMLMDDGKQNSSREHGQRLFNKNVELENKRKKPAQARIPSDPNTWQNMRENYEAIVLGDQAFSEQHDVEYALWQWHYKRIEELRALYTAALASAASQRGKVPVHAASDRLARIRSQFKTFLSEATGFYHDLMLKIRSKYGLPLEYFSDDPVNQIPISKDGNKSSDINKGLMSCHRCLIYLGDLSRYKSLYGEGDSKTRDFTAASSYYMQAFSLCPSSGNPHHQLAILAGYSNDELLSIYRYFRSLAVESPFVTARDNLIIAFGKNCQNYTQLLADAKSAKVNTIPSRVAGKGRSKRETGLPFKDEKAFITRFVRLNGILFMRTSLETFPEVLEMVKKDLMELLSSELNEELNLGSDSAKCRLAIVRMVAILIFTVYNVSRENENKSYADILQCTVLLQNAFTATFELMGCIVEQCNQLSDPSSSYLLPGIMVFVEWLVCSQDIAIGCELEDKQANARSFFWNRCVFFLNKLLLNGYTSVNKDENETFSAIMDKSVENVTVNCLALPEDFELRGFLPLVPAQLILDFSRRHSFSSDVGNKEKMVRISRIIAAGKALANIVRIGQKGVYFDTKLKKFSFGTEPQKFDDNFLLPHVESKLNGYSLNISVGDHMSLGVVSTKDVAVDRDDEDEVIVFKPSTNDKYSGEFASRTTLSEVPTSVSGPGKINFGSQKGVFSDVQDSFPLQAASNASLKSDVSVANNTSQYLHPLKHSSAMYPVECYPVQNGLALLNLRGNGSPIKSEARDKFGIVQPAALSVLHSPFVDDGVNHKNSIQIPQAAVQSKIDPITFSGTFTDSQPVKPSSMMTPGLKKNPVSRPIRHIGPPPGFGAVPYKVPDEPSHKSDMKNEIPSVSQMDDYCWLDEYQKASLNQKVGFSSSAIYAGPTFTSAANSNCSMGIPAFPFPGKQVTALNVRSDYEKGWSDYQLPELIKQHEDEQQCSKLHQQYQGRSLWEGQFYV